MTLPKQSRDRQGAIAAPIVPTSSRTVTPAVLPPVLFLIAATLFLSACGHQAGGYRIYVTNETSGDLTVIDSSSMDVIATIPLGKRPRGIHPSPDGRFVYVALSGSPPAGPGVDESTLPPPDKSADAIGVFDVEQNKVARTIQGGSDPENFDVSKDGKTLYISNEDASGVSFVDVASGKVTQTVPTGEEPEGVKVTPDGKLVFATSEDEGTIAVIDPAAGKRIKVFKVGRRPRSIAFLPDGSHGYVNAENDGGIVLFDAVKMEQVQPIPLGQPGVIKPMGLLLSPDGSKLYVSTGRGQSVFVVDTATNKPTGSFEVGQRPWGMAFSPDSKTLFTANGPSNDISVVDLATQKVTKKIKCTGSPWGIAVVAR
jgi:YVTN family beta-propeller protein